MASPKKFQRGALVEFNTWHDAIKIREDIPAEGKINFVNGVPAPDKQRTTAFSEPIPHPTIEDDYIWDCGGYCAEEPPVFDKEEVMVAGWFPDTAV